MPTFRDAVRHWQRKEVPRLDGKLGLGIGERSSHTMATIQLEWPHAKQKLREADKFVIRQLDSEEYAAELCVFMRENPKADPYALLIQQIRERIPGLDGLVSDVGLTDLINRANRDGKFSAWEVYAQDVEYFTKGEVSKETVKIYCKPSHKSRQRKQTTRGRPPKKRS